MIDRGLGTILASAHVFRPAYLELLASGVLDERVDAAWVHRAGLHRLDGFDIAHGGP